MDQWLLKIAWHGRASWTFQHGVSILCENRQPQRAPSFGLRQRSTERTQLKDVIWKFQEVVAGGALLGLRSVSWSLLNKGNQGAVPVFIIHRKRLPPESISRRSVYRLKGNPPTLVVWFSICLDLVKGKVKRLLIGISHI